MPIKRRSAKARAHRITPEAVELFKTATEHRPRYYGCIRGDPCRSTELGRHCDDCRAYIDAASLLHRLLGLRPWEPTVLDDDELRSAYNVDDDCWVRIRELRAELKRLAG